MPRIDRTAGLPEPPVYRLADHDRRHGHRFAAVVRAVRARQTRFGAWRDYEMSRLRSIDFSQVLMEGMLSLLLFAGELHVDLSELQTYKWQVGILAVFGTHRASQSVRNSPAHTVIYQGGILAVVILTLANGIRCRSIE